MPEERRKLRLKEPEKFGWHPKELITQVWWVWVCLAPQAAHHAGASRLLLAHSMRGIASARVLALARGLQMAVFATLSSPARRHAAALHACSCRPALVCALKTGLSSPVSKQLITQAPRPAAAAAFLMRP